MLRIHFTARDLENLRIARQPDPLWELVCALCRLRSGQGPLEFGDWRRATTHRLRDDRTARNAVLLAQTLTPATGYIPDFLTPPVSGQGLSAGLEQVRATPAERLDRELNLLAASRPVPSWVASSGTAFTAPLATALSRCFQALLEPYWPHVRSAVGNDVGLRSQQLLDGGTRALFAGLRPWARWNAPVLEVDYPKTRDLHLKGRGLLLVPSYFCWRRPTALADPDLAPVLVYPVAKRPLGPGPPAAGQLERLLGRTRSAVLSHVAAHPDLTTTEVAHAVGIALPSVSHQLSVLRDGGLVVSRREGRHVLHSATALALSLLDLGGAVP